MLPPVLPLKHNILKTSLKYLWQIYVIQVHYPRSLQVRILYLFDKLLSPIQQQFDSGLQLKPLVVDCFFLCARKSVTQDQSLPSHALLRFPDLPQKQIILSLYFFNLFYLKYLNRNKYKILPFERIFNQ